MQNLGVLLWCSQLRIWCCHCSGWGHCSRTGSAPGLGTSIFYRLSQKKKKKKRKEKKSRILFVSFLVQKVKGGAKEFAFEIITPGNSDACNLSNTV